MVSALLDAPLIAGLLPTVISIAGLLGGMYLLWGSTRAWWTRSVAAAIVVGIVVAATTAGWVAWFRPFPEPLPPRMLLWIAVAVAALVLAAARLRRTRSERPLWSRPGDRSSNRGGGGRRGRLRRWLDLLAIAASLVAVVSTALVKANAFYGYRPTLAAVLGFPPANQIELGDLPRIEPEIVAAPRQPLARTWHSPPGMPRTGSVLNVDIPGHHSGFIARKAWVYLPPAYLGSPRAKLPVLVLIPGQPGGPRDWILAGRLVPIMDAFAAAHDGLAPVVVVPDATGAAMANTLCLDSRLGAAETYLARDVPAWAAATLQVDAAPWAIGGFSFGGTCALQLAVRHPDLFPTFLDISGQAQPTLGDLELTVRAAFGGDHDAYRRANPLDELTTAHLPDSAGILVVGQDDPAFRAQAEQVAFAATAAGVSVRLHEVPGHHSWTIASDALASSLVWICGRTGLLEPTAPP